MNETLTWVAILGAGGGGSIITFITFWMALSTRIANAESTARAADDRGRSAETLAATALAKNELLSRDVGHDRVEAASKLAALEAATRTTTASLAQAETRLAKSIEDMGEKIDHLSDTLIKTLGEMIARKDQH